MHVLVQMYTVYYSMYKYIVLCTCPLYVHVHVYIVYSVCYV